MAPEPSTLERAALAALTGQLANHHVVEQCLEEMGDTETCLRELVRLSFIAANAFVAELGDEA